jgi:DNA gyrase/topoisomerase IV subunit B
MQKIKVLEEIEHIRLRKGMYIGEAKDVTHLIEEILDNALDEVANGHGSVVALMVDSKHKIYSIIDNGRGLPVYKEDRTGQDIPIVLSTKLFSGGKFSKDNYKVSVGLNGVGLVVVNALSQSMKIIVNHIPHNLKTYKDKIDFGNIDIDKIDSGYIKFQYIFKDAQLVEKIVEHIPDDNIPFSTYIEFKPDSKYFDSLDYDKKFIEDRLKIASVFTNAKILYDIDGKRELINITLNDFFKTTMIKEDECLPPIHFKWQDKKTLEGIDLILTYNLHKDDILTKASVNLLPVNDGTHVNYLNNLIGDMFQDFAKKKGFQFNKLDSLIGLRYYVNIYILQTDFSSQTKEKLTTNKKYFEHTFKPIEKELTNYFKNNEEVLLQLLNKFQDYRNALKGRKVTRKLVTDSVTRGLRNKDSRLRDCSSTDVSKCELIICEGESAAGSLLQARDPKYHAILPLKGKIINVNTNDPEKILKNKEIIDIIQSIGIGMLLTPKDKIEIDKIKYDKIILAADRDPDGGHIMVLLMAAFLKFVPDLIKEGHLYVSLPPLYAIKGKNFYKPFQTLDQLKTYIESNPKELPAKYDIVRYKGLGEMNPDELKIAVIDTNTRNLVKLDYPENPDNLIEYLQSGDKKRELVLS